MIKESHVNKFKIIHSTIMYLNKTCLKIVITQLLITIISISSCSSDQTNAIEVLQFQVDSTLLNPIFTDATLNMQFCPPKNWRQMPADSVALVRASLSNMNLPQEKLQVKEVFLNTSQKSFAALSTFENGSDSLIQHMLTHYESIFNKNKTWNSVKKSSFKINDFTAHQFLLTNKDWVSFKLLFTKPNPTPFQIDYTMPFETYVSKVKILESSIGSTQLLTHD